MKWHVRDRLCSFPLKKTRSRKIDHLSIDKSALLSTLPEEDNFILINIYPGHLNAPDFFRNASINTCNIGNNQEYDKLRKKIQEKFCADSDQ
jgi:hypothetical protein